MAPIKQTAKRSKQGTVYARPSPTTATRSAQPTPPPLDQLNNLVQRNCKKLYLDKKTADVFFVFDTMTRIPAHKSILAAGSSVFEAMFYGDMKEKGDVRIVDASPKAFEEVLQFYYKSIVTLTAENIIEVANLCKKYGLTNELESCATSMKKLLTINEMCAGYGAAILLELNDVIAFCEESIKRNAQQIFSSSSFLECDRKVFGKVLELLVSSEYNAAVIVNACMDWAKAECARNDLLLTPANLKAQIGDSIDRIPFEKLSVDEFTQIAATYDEFFDKNDFQTIIVKLIQRSASQRNLFLPFDEIFFD